MTGNEAANKALVLKVLTELFEDQDASALDRYFTDRLIQHNPRLPDGTDPLRHGFAQRIGTDERALAGTPVLDPARTVRTDVNRVLWAEEIPQNVHVSGHVYDVGTGLVTTVVDAKARK